VKRRVLLLIKGLGRGGAEQLLVSAAKHLDMERFNYEVAYLLPHKDDLVGELESAGIRGHCLGGTDPGWIVRLRRLARGRGFDLVHSHLPHAGIGARVGLKGRTRLVYTEHNVWEVYRPATRLANMATLWAEDHVFAVSHHVKDSMRPRGSLARFVPRPPVEVLYHGIDLDAVEGWRRSDGVRAELGIPASAFVVGTVANFRAEKGHEDLIRAADLARRSIPDVRFVLVGRGSTESAIRGLVRRSGLEDTVTFAGYRTDAPRVCAAFDVFALSSLYEGLSIALIEAMALGKPAVVTRAGGLQEVVRDGLDGFVVPPRNPEALASRLVTLAQDPALRLRFASEARDRAMTFDIRNAVRRTEMVYEELLS
jgi:glycosyltransferase involved in cell wall biosynthesis